MTGFEVPGLPGGKRRRRRGISGRGRGMRTGMTTPSTREFAVVTGASSGIGYELARQFAEHGYDLLIVAEDEGIEQAAADLRRDGQNEVVAVRADLADYDGCEQVYREVIATGRRLDALAINAGRGIGGDFVRETDLI